VLASLPIRWRLTLVNASLILLIGGLLVGYTLWVAYRGVSTSVEASVEHHSLGDHRMLESGVATDDPASPVMSTTASCCSSGANRRRLARSTTIVPLRPAERRASAARSGAGSSRLA